MFSAYKWHRHRGTAHRIMAEVEGAAGRRRYGRRRMPLLRLSSRSPSRPAFAAHDACCRAFSCRPFRPRYRHHVFCVHDFASRCPGRCYASMAHAESAVRFAQRQDVAVRCAAAMAARRRRATAPLSVRRRDGDEASCRQQMREMPRRTSPPVLPSTQQRRRRCGLLRMLEKNQRQNAAARLSTATARRKKAEAFPVHATRDKI